MRKVILVLLFGALFSAQTWGIEPFVIKDIRVEGLQRISAGTVFSYLPVKVGDTLDDARSAETIRALFKAGFFKDVQLDRDGDVLVISVTERPSIGSVKISGNKDIESDVLTNALKEQGLVEGRVFDRALLDKVEQELNRQYLSRGKYAARIKTTVTPLERNRVGISIAISEGRAARIHEINIVGNKKFSDKKLRKNFQLSTPSFLSFYTGSDQYSKQKLTADLEALRSYYLDRGYINFNIESTQVSITPDKKDIYITINITEGEQFSVKDVKLAGDLVVPEQDLIKLVTVQSGDVFSRKDTVETTTKLAERLGQEGYAFTNINTIPEIDQENKQVSLTFFVDPGKRVYVRRINMVGNTKTRDEVLRREMRQLEGGWIDTEKVKRSRTRLEKLDYFEQVNVETPAVPGSTDQVDVNFSVVEKPSGNLLAGVGFSQSQGIIFNTSISQDNFMGSGKRVSAAFNNSSVNTVYSFAYTNPYYTLDGISRGFSLFSRDTDAGKANVADFTTKVIGASVNYGIPVNEFDTIRVGLGYESTDLSTTANTPNEYQSFLTDNGSQFDTIKLTTGWSHDTRNRLIFPDQGRLQNLTAEVGLPGGGLEYYKLSYRHQMLFPLSRDFTLSLNGDVGYGDSYGDTTEFPFFENFYGGGTRSVRGFKDNTLGPKVAPGGPSAGDPLGGNLRLVANAEVFFPVPFYKENKSVRLGSFFDVGNVYGTNEDFDAGELRYSVGVSATWYSPLGALSFSVAQPLNKQTGDDVQNFQFTLGTTF
ncbi:MAG: outer membrane protein assembly factor BamA [Gammaproteobacteria bacterium]